MASEVSEITINYEEDGVLLVQELDKEILSKGAWATIIFRFRQWDKKKEAYGPEQYTIRRYRKISGQYVPQSKFNISSPDQAGKIVQVLGRWLQAVDAD
ncbi:MAG TPA: hypothetical protein ENN98_00245 [Desulfurivibrio alkaliphilus]|uniref:Uncharacterized protein n=1 Tax=Desulfurivibrio alkaliphilus TaxID=427923 RepID=A0A7C2TJL6_9BACT|nr:hypothetical protein [Desulfurivibrio alkaliphilus]